MEYYPFDLSMPGDPRVELLKVGGGMAWAGMWYELLGMMWQTEMTDLMIPALAHKFMTTQEDVRAFLGTCADAGLIDRDALGGGLITNGGVGKRRESIEAKAKAARSAGKASGRARVKDGSDKTGGDSA